MEDPSVSKKIDQLLDLFKEASQSVKEEVSLSEQLKEINEKIDTIAEGMVAVADLVKEQVQKQGLGQRQMPHPMPAQPQPRPVSPMPPPKQASKPDFSVPSLEPGQLPPLPPIGPGSKPSLNDLHELPPLPPKKRSFFK